MGCLPSETRVRDVAAVLFGGWVPFVLRPLGGDEYELVGHCYIHGIMDGEWIKAALALGTSAGELDFDKSFQTFVIRYQRVIMLDFEFKS